MYVTWYARSSQGRSGTAEELIVVVCWLSGWFGRVSSSMIDSTEYTADLPSPRNSTMSISRPYRGFGSTEVSLPHRSSGSFPRSGRHLRPVSKRPSCVPRSCRHSPPGEPFDDNFGGSLVDARDRLDNGDNFGGFTARVRARSGPASGRAAGRTPSPPSARSRTPSPVEPAPASFP